MFTGLVDRTGTILALSHKGSGVQIDVAAGWDDLCLGESIAVNGSCLTAARLLPGGFSADLGRETLVRTSLGTLKAGARVNLERAIPAGGRLGGHLVSGHVDCTARITKIINRRDGSDIMILPKIQRTAYLVTQGSVAVDGISLTVARLESGGFWVSVIPHTLSHTNLGEKRTGDTVNLEFDMIAKYTESILRKGRT
jgi:riboflavin synthase